MTAVWAVTLPHADKLVLLALADNASDEGACFPSITTLSAKCGMDRSTILRAIARLENAGHVSRRQRSGRSTIYSVHPSHSATSRTAPLVAQRDPTRRTAPLPPVALCDPTRRTVRPITIKEPSSEPSKEPSIGRDDGAMTVFVHWQREWRHPTSKLDRKRRKRIEARLRDFTVNQLCDAISGFRNSPWHTGTDPKSQGVVYDSIDTLLRDNAQVEKGIALLHHPPRPPKVETAHDRMQRMLNGNDERIIEHDSGFPAITGR